MPCLRMAKKQGNAGSFKPGTSGNPNGRRASSSRSDDIDRMDAIVNTMTGMGMSRDKTSANSYTPDIASCEAGLLLWRGTSLGAAIVESIPGDALRQGYELCIGDEETPQPFTPEKPVPQTAPQVTPQVTPQAKQVKPLRKDARTGFTARARIDHRKYHRIDATDGKDLQESISKHWEDLQVNKLMKETWCYARAGGGGALLIGANDFATDLAQPLDLKKVRSLDYLTPLEARELVPLYYYNDPREPNGLFGKPAVYNLIPYNIGAALPGAAPSLGIVQIHESRLIIFDGPRVTRRTSYGAVAGWGDSVFTRCAPSLLRYLTATQGISSLLADFSQAVYKIKGLAELLLKNKNALRDKMVQVDIMRSIIRAIILDSEEDFERKATPMSGLPESVDRLATALCADARLPASKLFGETPAGLTASGDANIRWYYDEVATEQQDMLVPAIMKLLHIELAIAGEDPAGVNHSIRFNPLWQPSGKEQAEERFIIAQADAIYMDHDVYSPEECAASHYGGDQYSPDIHLDFDARAAMDSAVAPTVDANPQPDPILPPGNDPNASAGNQSAGDTDGAAPGKVKGE